MSEKRIRNEMTKKFPQTIEQFNLNYELFQIDLMDPWILGIFRNNAMILKLILPRDYPFKPPAVSISNSDGRSIVNYDKWSTNILDGMGPNSWRCKTDGCDYFMSWAFTIIYRPCLMKYWSFIPSAKNDSCLCCESILCSKQWASSKNMADILMEYIARRNFSHHCSKLMQRWIKPIFDNSRWYIPEDIILLILKKGQASSGF
jgi:ubiquitin-protein ligase